MPHIRFKYPDKSLITNLKAEPMMKIRDITELLHHAVSIHQSIYPDIHEAERPLYMNSVRYDENKEKIIDTGVCHQTASAVLRVLALQGTLSRSFFVWRDYNNPKSTDPFEDELVHVGIYHRGLFYDTLNSEGVSKPESLWFYSRLGGNRVTYDLDNPMQYAYPFKRKTPYTTALENWITVEYFRANPSSKFRNAHR